MNKILLAVTLLAINPSFSLSMSRNGVKLFCKRTSDFDQCVKDLSGQDSGYYSSSDNTTAPVRIEVIPYSPKSY